MSDSRFDLNPVEGEGDDEIFRQIEVNNKFWSTPIPELEAIFQKHGRPKAWLPTKDKIPLARKGTAANVKRYMQSPFVKQTLGAITGSDCSIKDTTIKGTTGWTIPIRIYTPGTRQASYPVMIMSHHGGFCTGDNNSEEFICRLLCRSYNLIIIDVAYRLIPEHTLDEARSDVWETIEWASKNSATISGDLSKGFIAAGVSAGGVYTLSLIYRARDENLQPPITGVLIVCTGAVTELKDSTQTKSLFPGRMLSVKSNEFAPFSDKATQECYAELANARALDPELSVFFRVDHSNLPPMYYQTAGMDWFRDGSLYYNHLYRKAGNKCRTEVYEGVPHMWWMFYSQLAVTHKWAKDLVEGTRWLLAQKAHTGLRSQL